MATLNNDIERYIRGELTPAEMHALEQKALQDPFLAEALEGAQHAGAENFSVDIELLKHAVKAKSHTKRLPRTITLNGWGMYAGIAAGLVLLAVSTYVIFLSIENKRSRDLAGKKKSPSSEVTDTIASHQPAADSLIALNAPQLSEPVIQDNIKKEHLRKNTAEKNRAHTSAKPIVTDSEKEEAFSSTELTPVRPLGKEEGPGETKDLTYIQTDTITDDKTNISKLSEKRRDEVIVTEELQGKVAGVQVAANENHLVRGRITSGGEPLPGVNVIVKGTTHGTVTDVHGNYMISTPPGKQTLQIAFIGYSTEEVLIGSDDHVNVDLKPDVSALSEVVVTGYSTSSPDDIEEEFEMAAPEEGRKAFSEYLKNNMRYPKDALDNKIEGKVTVQFFVETNGELSDFTAVKSIGYGCDEELIRLIKQGPPWSPSLKNGIPVRERVRIRLKFELPK